MTIHPHAKEIAQQIFQEICSGHFSMGTRLTEAMICERLNIPRTHVREALIYLVHCNVIETTPKKAFFVIQLTPNKLHQLLEMAEMVSQFAAHKIAAHHNQTDFQPALQLLNAMEKATAKLQATAFNSSSLQLFHWLLSQNNNDYLQQSLVKIEPVSKLLFDISDIKQSQMVTLLDSYYQSYDAIVDGSADFAVESVHNILRMRYVMSRWDLHRLNAA